MVLAGVAATADRPQFSVEAGLGAGARLGIRWRASCGHPRCRARATYVPGLGRCEPPDGKRRSSSEPGCGANSRGVRSSPGDRRWGAKKIFCCVTTRGRNVRVLNGFGRGLGAVPALFFGLGVLGLDAGGLPPFGLAAGRLPALDLPLAVRILAVALVPAPRLVLASASFAQADPGPRSAPSGPTTVFALNLRGAHGRLELPKGSSGRM